MTFFFRSLSSYCLAFSLVSQSMKGDMRLLINFMVLLIMNNSDSKSKKDLKVDEIEGNYQLNRSFLSGAGR